MSLGRLLLLSVITCAAGCGDAGVTPDAGLADAGATEDAGRADAGEPDAGPQTCAELLSERRVALDLEGPLTQIHASVDFDGEGIWVVYSRPEPGGGNFDVWATRRGCGGEVLVEPFLVQADPAGNDIDPTLARSGDTLLIAWMTDDGTGGTDNLQIRYRTFTTDGSPVMPSDGRLETRRSGEPITDNHSGVELGVLPDGRFIAAGGRAVPEAMRFQAYAQIIGVDGTLDGEALEPALEPMVTHQRAAIDATPDGSLLLAYQRDTDGGEVQVMLSALDGSAPELVIEGLAASAGPDVLAHGASTYVAFSGEGGGQADLRIVDVSVALASRTMRTLGEAGRLEHSPRLAAGEGAAAVAYFRQIRGFTNELLLASVTDETIAPVLVEAQVPAYQPAVTHVLGDFWFVAYSIGDSPDFRLVGRFVRLAPG